MQRQEPLISIIVPVYNTELYLNQCVESILKQTYKNIQLILVDDGSTDNSGKICDEYALKDKRVEVLHEENSGVSDARNKGLKYAKGEYIGFVDSDDYIKETMYQDMYNLILERNADVSICNFCDVKEDKVTQKNKDSGIQEFTKIQILNELILDRNVQSYVWNKLYKKELFDNIKFPKGKKYEDIETVFYVLEKCNKVVLSSKAEYYYLNRKDSIVNNVNEQTILDYIDIIEKRYKYVSKEYKELMENNIYYYTKTLITAYKDAYFLKSISETLKIKLIEYYNNVKELIKNNESQVIKIFTNQQKMELYTLLYDKTLFYKYLENFK